VLRARNYWKENAMRYRHSCIFAASAAVSLQAFEITGSDLPGAQMQNLDRRLWNSHNS
jgi:hypothetical protein